MEVEQKALASSREELISKDVTIDGLQRRCTEFEALAAAHEAAAETNAKRVAEPGQTQR